MRSSLRYYFTVFCVTLFCSGTAYAEFECPKYGFLNSDLENVRLTLSDTDALMSRLIILGAISTTDQYSCTQRMALSAEYNALIDLFDDFKNRYKISRYSRRYIYSLLGTAKEMVQYSSILSDDDATDPECSQYSKGAASTALSLVSGASRYLAHCSPSGSMRYYRPRGRR